MLCVNFIGYQRACGPLTAGISDIGIFDPNDLNFTQAAAISGVNQPYTAVAERDGVTTPSVFPVNFQIEEAEYTWKQTKKGCTSQYEHEVVLQLQENAQLLSTFLEALDNAGCCCGIGLFIRLNTEKILVAGEKYVNDTVITRFIMAQDGSDGTSGKVFNDLNGGNIHIKGNYKRPLYEYTGTWATVLALTGVTGSGA